MVFSSLTFICIFLPVLFILHTLVRNTTFRNILLVMASLLFYAYGEPVYILLMLVSIMANYIFGMLVTLPKKGRKWFLTISVLFNLFMLAVFKYAGFFVTTLNQVSGTDIPVPELRLPIGISFYTFQALSYVIDVYRKEVTVQKNPGNLTLYITFFPQLIAGPIVKYHDIEKQIHHREVLPEQVAQGIRRFIFGLSKKVLISNPMASVADAIFALSDSNINLYSAWIGAIAYMLQIYYDFSGYSDMAIGMGKMFGFHFKENFNYPYSATSIKDFWRRWHISLSTWFKEYLYIPLGGNRKGRLRTCLNKLVVFFCTGLWHGANWTFIVWGLFHGFFSLLEEYLPKLKEYLPKIKVPMILKRIYCLLVVCIGFVIFRADTLTQGLLIIRKMFFGFTFHADSMRYVWQHLTPLYIGVLLIAIAFSFPIKKYVESKIKENSILYGISYVISIVLFGFCMLSLASGTYNPFIYFRF